jgi:hypothetical protein
MVLHNCNADEHVDETNLAETLCSVDGLLWEHGNEVLIEPADKMLHNICNSNRHHVCCASIKFLEMNATILSFAILIFYMMFPQTGQRMRGT